MRCLAESAGDAADPARARRDALWARHEASLYAELPPLSSAPLAAPRRAVGILGRMLVDPFYRSSPVFAPFAVAGETRRQRTKLFHPYGSLAKARLEMRDSPYDGLLRVGAPCLVRLSLGSSDANYVPGLGLLAFAGESGSASLVAVQSLDALTFCAHEHHLPAEDRRDFRDALAATCEEGDTLYGVWAGGRRIGALVLESRFSASSFADRELAIRHHA